MKKFTFMIASILTLSIGLGVQANAQEATVKQNVTAEIIKGDFVPSPDPDKPSVDKPSVDKPSGNESGGTSGSKKPTGESKPNIKNKVDNVSTPSKPNIDASYLDTGAGKSTMMSIMGLSLFALGVYVLNDERKSYTSRVKAI